MGLFEDSIREGMESAEFRRGWDEAEAELAAYYASIVPRVVSFPQAIAVFAASSNVALGEHEYKTTFQPNATYRPFVLS